MAVVTKYSSAMPDPTTYPAQPKSVNVEGRVKSLFGSVAVANGDSIASQFFVGKIPSHARILPSSAVHCTAVTGAAINFGFDISGKAAVLLAAQTIATAAKLPATAAVAVADQSKFAWELAGYAQDPGTQLTLVAALTAAATAAGTVVFDIQYAL